MLKWSKYLFVPFFLITFATELENNKFNQFKNQFNYGDTNNDIR